ncbi:MAG TPA: ribonuclease E/G [Patescibacteria group bacterium]|nr:ribonuclease E/G [Patescibacteria group bacterium]
MSGLELFIDDIDGRLHAAVVKKTGLDDLYVDALNKSGNWGSIYLGRITKLDKKLDAAIVDLGNGLSGLLPAKHIHLPGGDPSELRSGLTDLVKPGQMVIVQIKSEAKRGSAHEHHKLPKLTTLLYLMGHHLVYCPLSNPVTMSRSIERGDVLSMTASLAAKGGWILQGHAEEEDLDILTEEAQKLLDEWQVLLGVQAEGGRDPSLLKGGPNAFARAMFDYGAYAFDHIYAGSRAAFDIVAQWCEKYDPPLASSKRLRLFRPEKVQQRLFDIHDIYGELQELAEPVAALPCGGTLIIDVTHAATVIDVNQGPADNAMLANTEAVTECARQLRLRNISGAILIDFIGMAERPARLRITEAAEAALADDPAQAQVHGFTRLGILEITRKRRAASYAEKMSG